MTEKPPTDPEAVERLAWRVHESKAGKQVRVETCATLRALSAEKAALRAEVERLRGALSEAVEVVHKAYVVAKMEAVNAGPAHPLVKNYEAWRARCMHAETRARAALTAPAPHRK